MFSPHSYVKPWLHSSNATRTRFLSPRTGTSRSKTSGRRGRRRPAIHLSAWSGTQATGTGSPPASDTTSATRAREDPGHRRSVAHVRRRVVLLKGDGLGRVPSPFASLRKPHAGGA